MENKVFLENLPKTKNEKINWKECVGLNVKCIYNDCDYTIKIVDYFPKTQKLKLQYGDRKKEIGTGSFCKCGIGNLIMKITSDFKLEVGDYLIDEKRNLLIINREIRKDNKKKKWYKYRCLKCGYEGYVVEHSIVGGCGCSCCSGITVVKGLNDIGTARPDLVKYFKNEDESYAYTRQSGKRVDFKCPDCGFEKKMIVCDLYNQGFHCNKCGDGISVPEKFIINILSQLKIKFIPQLSKTTFKWCDKYRYDFYIPDLNIIIETHGEQHYVQSTGIFKNIDKQIKNDIIKKSLALKNGIEGENYIVIDCRKSDFEYIKSNILSSKLNSLFRLEDIDWKNTIEFISSNLSVKVRERWNDRMCGEYINATTIAKEFNLNTSTVCRYLRFWTKLNMCDYISNEIHKVVGVKNGESSGRRVEIFSENGVLLGEFRSCSYLAEISSDYFNVKLVQSAISESARTGKKYKGYTFKYV